MNGTVIFWLAAAALTLGLGVLVFAFSAMAARRATAGGEDPSVAVYRRQLEELDELAQRGLLAEDEKKAARAEAGRRLITAADRAATVETAGSKETRLILAGGALLAVLCAGLLYAKLGSAGAGDQPYKARLKNWMSSDLEFLTPPELAAVLRNVVAMRPKDVQALTYLARAELSAGDAAAAAQVIARARRLEPGNLDLIAAEAQVLVAEAEDKVTPQAEADFRKVLAADPTDVAARYYLGKADIAAGRKDQGVAAWKALAAELPAEDERKARLEQEIAAAEGKGGLAAQIAQADAPAQAQFIKGMVTRLAGRLKEKPDDAEGWTRLIRAYGVLGDTSAQTRAIADMRKAFAARPAMALEIENAAKGPPQ